MKQQIKLHNQCCANEEVIRKVPNRSLFKQYLFFNKGAGKR